MQFINGAMNQLEKTLHNNLSLNDSVHVPGADVETDQDYEMEYPELADGSFNNTSFRNFLVLDHSGYGEKDSHTVRCFKDLDGYKQGINIVHINSKGKSNTKKILFNLQRNILHCGKRKKISFAEFDEIRIGNKTNIFNIFKTKGGLQDDYHERSFSLMYGNNKSLDFICSHPNERKELVSVLFHIIEDCKATDNEFSFVKREWESIGKDALKLSDVKKLLAKLNYSTSTEQLTKLANSVDKNNDGKMCFSELTTLLHYLRSRPEVRMILFRYTGGEEQMTIEQMIKFFKEEQAETWTEQDLDVWDGTDGDPIIFHGKTLTSQIKFSHVLETIKARAFESSPFPVVLSLETHCSVPQQIKMADHLKEILGDMLPSPLSTESSTGSKCLPSLDDLKYKVLLKGYCLHPPVHSATPSTAELEVEYEDEYVYDDEFTSSQSSSTKKKIPKAKIAEELSNLIYLKTEPFKTPEHTTNERQPWEMHSFSEAKVSSMLDSSDTTRVAEVYPKGTRFNSSNYDPAPGWLLGCQIVALNHQTSSTPMWINQGMFQDNGGVGYVLKPECLLPGTGNGFDPSGYDRHPSSKYSKLKVSVISARQLPKYTKTTKGEVIDPFVTLSIHGAKSDVSEVKTKVIDNNGFNPYWGEEFEFSLIHSQLDLLLIRVDDADKFGRHNRIGHYCIRVENIRPGYRILRLKNDFGHVIPLCNIFCRFSFEV
eukprot:gene14595-17256_t